MSQTVTVGGTVPITLRIIPLFEHLPITHALKTRYILYLSVPFFSLYTENRLELVAVHKPICKHWSSEWLLDAAETQKCEVL